ncbi:MAG: rhodanese-like domain-containing protein [Clostridiaceae bacterium]|jgi:rhodanese-related sulfurtransferase|nr:rhodanese-like domain-containing protein [Clostridiaceae bacterium]
MRKKAYLTFALCLLLVFSLVACEKDYIKIEAVRLRANSYLVISQDDLSHQIGDLVTISFPAKLDQPPVGSLAQISLSQEIRESYPPQADAKAVELIDEKALVVTDPNVAEKIAWHLGENVFLIDVRTEAEYIEGHISGSLLMPVEVIADRIVDEIPDRDAVLLLYCRSGNRSATAGKMVRELGYSLVIDAGGIIKYEGKLITGSDPGAMP